jgi:hypothetical protein
MNGQRHAPDALYAQEKTPCTYWLGAWVGLTAGLDTEARGILCLCRSQTLVVQSVVRYYTYGIYLMYI